MKYFCCCCWMTPNIKSSSHWARRHRVHIKQKIEWRRDKWNDCADRNRERPKKSNGQTTETNTNARYIYSLHGFILLVVVKDQTTIYWCDKILSATYYSFYFIRLEKSKYWNRIEWIYACALSCAHCVTQLDTKKSNDIEQMRMTLGKRIEYAARCECCGL